MSEVNEQFEEIKKLKKQYEDAVKAVGREGISKLLAPLFERYPRVLHVTWTQYTPYFNDGEPCEFNANGRYADVTFSPAESDVMTKESAKAETRWSSKDPAEQEAIKAFHDALGIDDSVMLAAFGDHVEVTVDRNGIEVVEYEHE